MEQIEIIARGVCVQNGKILLAYFKEKEYYFLPGGHVEHGESIFQALKREILEETGLSAQIKDLAFVFEHTWKNKERLVHEMNYILTYDIREAPEDIPAKVDHLKFVWVPIEQFNAITFLSKEIRGYVDKVIEGDSGLRFFSTIRQ